MPKLYKAPEYTEDEIEAMQEDEMSFPYTDKYMRYDSVKRQYIPTEELLVKHGVDFNKYLLNDPVKVAEELEYISDQIYTYIAKRSGSNSNVLKWIIAKGVRRGMTPFRFRTAFEEAMWKQAIFYLNNGDPTKNTGLDLEQKQWLNKDVLENEDRQIDPRVKVLLMNLGLTWLGSYDDWFGGFALSEDW